MNLLGYIRNGPFRQSSLSGQPQRHPSNFFVTRSLAIQLYFDSRSKNFQCYFLPAQSSTLLSYLRLLLSSFLTISCFPPSPVCLIIRLFSPLLIICNNTILIDWTQKGLSRSRLWRSVNEHQKGDYRKQNGMVDVETFVWKDHPKEAKREGFVIWELVSSESWGIVGGWRVCVWVSSRNNPSLLQFLELEVRYLQ